VAMGRGHTARAAERRGRTEPGGSDRSGACVASQGHPAATEIAADQILEQATHDKKRHGDTINVVVPIRVGAVEMRTISLAELGDLIKLSCDDAHGGA